MSYIVRNCPCYDLGFCTSNQVVVRGCINCTDCVIKQVIQMCKEEAVINYPKREKEFITVNGYQAILNIFDIEEINK